MNPSALGWDNHRKFSKVSVMEKRPVPRSETGPSTRGSQATLGSRPDHADQSFASVPDGALALSSA
jgi:hypothetical protein